MMDEQYMRKILPDAPKMDANQLDQWMRENGGRGREVMRYWRKQVRDPLTGEKLSYAECECTVCRGKWDAFILTGMGGYPRVETQEGMQSPSAHLRDT